MCYLSGDDLLVKTLPPYVLEIMFAPPESTVSKKNPHHNLPFRWHSAVYHVYRTFCFMLEMSLFCSALPINTFSALGRTPQGIMSPISSGYNSACELLEECSSPYNGQFGNGSFVLYKENVLFQRSRDTIFYRETTEKQIS